MVNDCVLYLYGRFYFKYILWYIHTSLMTVARFFFVGDHGTMIWNDLLHVTMMLCI